MASRNAEVAVGVTVLLAFALVIWSVTFLRQVRLAESTQRWIGYFPEVGGLGEDDPVSVNGVKKGSVQDIKLVNGRVLVTFRLERDVALTSESHVYVRNVGMMGEKFLAIDASPGGRKLIAERDTIVGQYESGVPEVVSQMGTALAALERLSDQVDRMLALAEERGTMKKSLANIEAASLDMRSALADSREDLVTLAANLRATSEITRRTAEASEPRLERTFDHVERTSVRLDSLLARVDTLSIELTAVARKVNSGDGTTAKLINERKLYDETRAAVREIALLVREVRNDPKKFFKVSVF